MKNLIEALQIFLKYRNQQFPTHCEHDVLYVVGFFKDEISPEDVAKLEALHFDWDDSMDCWMSTYYGSA